MQGVILRAFHTNAIHDLLVLYVQGIPPLPSAHLKEAYFVNKWGLRNAVDGVFHSSETRCTWYPTMPTATHACECHNCWADRSSAGTRRGTQLALKLALGCVGCAGGKYTVNRHVADLSESQSTGATVDITPSLDSPKSCVFVNATAHVVSIGSLVNVYHLYVDVLLPLVGSGRMTNDDVIILSAGNASPEEERTLIQVRERA